MFKDDQLSKFELRYSKMLLKEIVLIALSIASASAGFSQYYVTPHFASQFTPAVHLVHHQPLAHHLSGHTIFGAPSFYQAQPFLVSHNVNPFLQQPFVSPLPQVNVEQARSSSRQSSGRNLDGLQSEPVQGSEYGFGYRTQYDDGATSMVVFVSGPDSKRMSLLRNNKLTSRNLGSDVSISKTSEEKNEKINHALFDDIPGLNFDALVDAFPDFKPLEEHKSGVVHLFSHPANVFPLNTPTQTTTTASPETTVPSEMASNDDSDSVSIESADNDELQSRSTGGSDKEAESIIQETKVRIEGIKNRSLNEKSSTEKSQMVSTSEEATTSTTIKNEEEETTTQQ